MLNTLAGIIASSGGAAAGGDYESIATVTVGSGGATTINFNSIPSTYQHLQIRFSLTTTLNNMPLIANFNADTANNYARHYLLGQGTTVGAGAIANTNTINFFGYAIGTNTTNPTVGVIDLLDYDDTNKFKTTRTLVGMDANGSGEIVLSSGLYRSTSAITAIELAAGSDFAQYSSFALYGIKG